MNAPAPVSSDIPSNAPRPNGKRGKSLALLACVFLLLALAWGAYWFYLGRWQESTDDAYVTGHIVQITPQVGGTVRAVRVNDTDEVVAGEVLAELDDADSRVALEQAEAALAQVVLQTRVLHVNTVALRAQVVARRAEVERLEADWKRRAALAAMGGVSREDLDRAREALAAGRAAQVAAQEQLRANQALATEEAIERHPNVRQAATRVEEAWLAWSRARIVAPVRGQVAKRNTQVGQKVAAGAPLMAVIPLDALWVEANFKESQLGRMRVAQPVTLTADYYGSDIRYRGRIAGFAAGTGSAFALLPAQNATGNWIKVVQRVPVRIELEAGDLQAHPLRIGLSMQVTVDLLETETSDAPPKTVLPADGRDDSSAALDAARVRIAAIIRQHQTSGADKTAGR
ncbi:multidrug resistance protein A [Betaproteobacteria bacterium]|nr:multidrug resistance protein A [Betaproteobacteria bacterium]